MEVTITLNAEEFSAETISELLLEIDKARKKSTAKIRAEQVESIQKLFKDFRQRNKRRAYCVR